MFFPHNFLLLKWPNLVVMASKVHVIKREKTDLSFKNIITDTVWPDGFIWCAVYPEYLSNIGSLPCLDSTRECLPSFIDVNSSVFYTNLSYYTISFCHFILPHINVWSKNINILLSGVLYHLRFPDSPGPNFK